MKRNTNSFSSLTDLSESLRMELAVPTTTTHNEDVGEVDLRGDAVKVPPAETAETVLGVSLRRMTSVTLSGCESSSSSLQSDSSWLDLESVKLEASTKQLSSLEMEKTTGAELTKSTGTKPTITSERTRRRHSTLTCSESNVDSTDSGRRRGIRPSLQTQWANSSRDIFNRSSSSDEGPSALQQFFADRQLVRETNRGTQSVDANSSHESSTLPSAKDLTIMVKKDSLAQSRPVKRRGSFDLLKETFMSSMQNLSEELDLQNLSQEIEC